VPHPSAFFAEGGIRNDWAKQAPDASNLAPAPRQARHNYLNAITPNNPSNPLFGPAVK
jgi:hypothetical protein